MSKNGHLQFDPDLVISYHKKEQFRQIPKDRIMQFSQPLSPKSDGEIIKTWTGHLSIQGIPYAITKQQDRGRSLRWVIWKERVAKEGPQNAYYRDRRERLKNAKPK